MMHKILGRIASARSFVFAAFALAMSAASAFDTHYLTFRNPASFTINVYSPKWDGTMEYSTDKANWTTWTGSSISAAQSGDEYFLYLRGTGNSSARGIGGGMSASDHGTLVVGPGMVAKGGDESSNLTLLPSVESTGVVTDANGISTEATYNLNVEGQYVYTFDANDLTWKFIWSENTSRHETRIVLYNDGHQDGRAAVIDDATEGAIVLPSHYGRTSITCIGDQAFYDCTNLTSVTVPNGITAIGDMAFCGCSNFVSVRIPSSVVQVGYYAFLESALETVYVDPGTIASVSNLLVATDEDFDVSGLEFIEVCDVAFNANYGGGGATTNMMRYGQAVGTLPVLAREHYTFLGWFTAAEGGEQISAETQVTQNATYYAHWTSLVADWPEDTSTVASQTAAEAFYIAGDLAGVNAKTLADWAKASRPATGSSRPCCGSSNRGSRGLKARAYRTCFAPGGPRLRGGWHTRIWAVVCYNIGHEETLLSRERRGHAQWRHRWPSCERRASAQWRHRWPSHERRAPSCKRSP